MCREGRTDVRTDGWTYSPCVLQDYVPFGAAAQKPEKTASQNGKKWVFSNKEGDTTGDGPIEEEMHCTAYPNRDKTLQKRKNNMQ